MYATKYYGTPYSYEGEFGPDVPTIKKAEKLARKTLQRGQRLDLLDGSESTANLCARWERDASGKFFRVTIDPNR